MKTFQQFLIEAIVNNSSDNKQLDKQAEAMFEALWFEDSDSDQQVYNILHACDKIHREVYHDGYTLEGASIARKYSGTTMIFSILEYCHEVTKSTFVNDMSFDEEDIITPEQADKELKDQIDREALAVKTKSNTFVVWDPNIAEGRYAINKWTEEKVKKIIKMMCELHDVEYHEEVFSKFKPSKFMNPFYGPLRSWK